MNIVPKSGGNTSTGLVFASGTGQILQSDNLTPALEGSGCDGGEPLTKVYDVSGTLGGPVRRIASWYFVNAHVGGSPKTARTSTTT